MKNHPIILFLRLSRPLFLVGAFLVYALGAGIARYLGSAIDWNAFFLGQAWITAAQLAVHYLNEYFDAPTDADNEARTPFSGGSGVLGEGEGHLSRRVAQVAAAFMLTAVAVLTVAMSNQGLWTPALVTVGGLIFLGAILYSVPPVRLSHTGYGELTTSILVANLVPAFGFLLQAGEFHRLLAMSTFPLMPLHLAMMLALEFPDYASDIKHEKRTLLVRIGWRNGMTFHNVFALAGYSLLGLAAAFGMPFRIALPAFLPLTVAVLQIWYFRRIADGIKPNWTALTLNAIIMFGATAYLLAFAYWTR